MSNTKKSAHIDGLRQSLMDTLADLRNREQPMEVDRARAIAEVATVLVATAKVECDYLRLTGQDRSNFLETPPDEPEVPRIDGPSASNPFPVSTRHRLQG